MDIPQGIINYMMINRIRKCLALDNDGLARTVRKYHRKYKDFPHLDPAYINSHRHAVIVSFSMTVIKEFEPRSVNVPHNILIAGEEFDGAHITPVAVKKNCIMLGRILAGTLDGCHVKGVAPGLLILLPDSTVKLAVDLAPIK